ncbi:4-carboxymuconolactone decarboxylase [uncultured Jatrophihabitans sp.]|uniref:bifunctional 3-oxoadipate enol-lactonase/4-carboxymuconolactone decarboxylase PcaDC n=1 Tax=uncultured Jatrophihabitans sp. TaxID=1610747 RepID=UPI0035CBF6AF
MTPHITIVRLSTAGPGRPLLVLGPSLGTSVASLWGRCAAELADRFEIVGWELPGHGRGTPSSGPFSVGDVASGVVAAVDAAYGPAADFAYSGDSFGGAVGLALLLEHGARVRSATLACTAARIGTPESWLERAATVRQGGTSVLVEPSAGRWFGPGFAAREPALSSGLLDALAATDDESYAAACEALASFDVRDRLGGIATPCTLVGGTHDQVTPMRGLHEIASAVDGARVVELPVAHLAPAEDPVTVAALIAAGDLAAVGASGTAAQARAAGLQMRRAVAGDAWVDRAIANATPFTREFQDLITQYAWGTIWTRPGLDRRSRSIITLTALVARGHHDELAMHVRGALTNGLSRDEIKEVLLQTAIYCGVPDANTAFRVASAVLAEIDEAGANEDGGTP